MFDWTLLTNCYDNIKTVSLKGIAILFEWEPALYFMAEFRFHECREVETQKESRNTFSETQAHSFGGGRKSFQERAKGFFEQLLLNKNTWNFSKRFFLYSKTYCDANMKFIGRNCIAKL